MVMNHRKGMRTWAVGVAVAACAATSLALGGGLASAAPGDSFYLSQKKKTFVSFVDRSGIRSGQQLRLHRLRGSCAARRARS